MQILLHPVGSHGDVHPFIGIGKALLARGHSVSLVTLDTYQPLAERNGFGFASTGTDEDFRRAMDDPDLWKPMKGLRVLFQNEHVVRLLRQGYGKIVELAGAGDTVVVAGTLGFAARTAHETHGIPLVTFHLQPATPYSVDSPPVYPSARPARWPRWARRAFYRFGDFLGDRWIGTELNKFRAELGLPPARRVLGQWMHSPQRVIGLFPKWFGTASDWPPQMVQTGFVRYDQDEKPVHPELELFLSTGEPPIVFSFGSAMIHGRPYFEAAVEACNRLNRRGLILARGGEQIPPNLPSIVAHFDYAPFSRVFPRAAAVVHHGGVGTTAQALAAGVPQLVVPLSFDQPDNADRVVKLGCGRTIPSRKFTPRRATRILRDLLSDPAVPERCIEIRKRLVVEDPLPETCRLIEEAVRRPATDLSAVSSGS
jgi:rhamnosyltransferase subunit B